MPRPTQLSVPQPCHERWDAMTPTGPGRHCAACQQVVVDFTQKTDAEILAHLAQLTGPRACGRFRAEQLGRPLVPPAAPSRWRSWLASVLLAGWGMQPAPVASKSLPHPAPQVSLRHLPGPPRRRPSTLAVKHVQGVVRDATTQHPLAGVAVFLRHENRSATTDSAGRFSLRLPARRPRGGRALVLHFTGYVSATVRLPATTKPPLLQQLSLRADPAAAGVEVVGQEYRREQVMITGMMPLPGSVTVAAPPTSRVAPGFFRRLLRSLRRHPQG